MNTRDVPIRDTSIRLGQFLKLASLVDTGGVGKELIADGAVRVNGVVETRRGRTLNVGDVVTIVEQLDDAPSGPNLTDDLNDEPEGDTSGEVRVVASIRVTHDEEL